ncbi:MAG: ABC transporter ATP-binding protein [Dermatophilaceae bacterium]
MSRLNAPSGVFGATPHEPAVRCRDLRKTYVFHEQSPGVAGAVRDLFRRQRRERVALTGLNLEVPAGQILGLLGPNGAGKTTTIKMLCGLLRPTSGEVDVLGFRPTDREFNFLRNISVVFGQKSMLWWDVSCYDSLLVHRQMYALSRHDFDASVAELAELLDVGGILHVPVRKLSLGERMRCELMLALLHRPRLLFADEPTVGLDVVAKASVRDFLSRVNATLGTTILLTSHDMDDVEALCHRVVVINHGAQCFDGDLATLRRSLRPRKQVRVSFTDALSDLPTLPEGVRLVDIQGPRLLHLEVERDALAGALAAVTSWGRVTDLDVRDADLDEVMTDLFRGEPTP